MATTGMWWEAYWQCSRFLLLRWKLWFEYQRMWISTCHSPWRRLVPYLIGSIESQLTSWPRIMAATKQPPHCWGHFWRGGNHPACLELSQKACSPLPNPFLHSIYSGIHHIFFPLILLNSWYSSLLAVLASFWTNFLASMFKLCYGLFE